MPGTDEPPSKVVCPYCNVRRVKDCLGQMSANVWQNGRFSCTDEGLWRYQELEEEQEQIEQQRLLFERVA